MGKIIDSISFQENHLSWIQVEVNGSRSLNIKRAIESPLPFVINFDNLQKSTTALQIANHLNSIAESQELIIENVRFLLSAKLGLIKTVQLDHAIPASVHREFVTRELGQVLPADTEEFRIFLPEYSREEGHLKQVISVAIRKDLFDFIQEIGDEAKLPLNHIGLNCFAIDELYRQFFPNLIGQTLLVNFTERGFEMVLSDEKNFLNFGFKPYSKLLKSIDQLGEKEIFSMFSTRLEELQRPGRINAPRYSVSQICLYGSYFKTQWLEKLQNQCSIPLRILNPTETTEWQIISEDQNFNPAEAYRYVEALSNIF